MQNLNIRQNPNRYRPPYRTCGLGGGSCGGVYITPSYGCGGIYGCGGSPCGGGYSYSNYYRPSRYNGYGGCGGGSRGC